MPARRSQWDDWGLRPDRGVIALMVTLTLSYLLFKLGPPQVQDFYLTHLFLTPRRALGPEPWQLVTSGFIESGLRAVFSVVVTLIFFGNAVERMVGAAELWKLYLCGTVGGGVFVALLARFTPLAGEPLPMGAFGAGTAILVAYAIMMSGREVMAFGMARMRGGSIAWIWIGIGVISCLLHAADGHPLEAAIELAGMTGAGLAGWLYAKNGNFSLRRVFDRMRTWRLKRRYRVLTGGRETRQNGRWLN